MPWIESHIEITRKPKFKALARDLHIKPAHLVGHLHVLWHSVLELAEDGDLASWSNEEIAEASGYSGNAAQYVGALQKNHWLDERLIHDWIEYAGRYLEAKYRTKRPDRLVSIWNKHSRQWEKVQKIVRSDLGQTQVRPGTDHLTLPNLTKQQLPGGTRGDGIFCGQDGNPVDKVTEGGLIDKNGMQVRPAEASAITQQIKLEKRLLDLRMPFGDMKGCYIRDLDPARARWLIKDWQHRDKLTSDLRNALELRVRLKNDEIKSR